MRKYSPALFLFHSDVSHYVLRMLFHVDYRLVSSPRSRETVAWWYFSCSDHKNEGLSKSFTDCRFVNTFSNTQEAKANNYTGYTIIWYISVSDLNRVTNCRCFSFAVMVFMSFLQVKTNSFSIIRVWHTVIRQFMLGYRSVLWYNFIIFSFYQLTQTLPSPKCDCIDIIWTITLNLSPNCVFRL